MESIQFDHNRRERTGLPEAVFCEGKPFDALVALLTRFASAASPILFTRLTPEVFAAVPQHLQQQYDYHALSRTAFAGTLATTHTKSVAIVSAGTSDAPVAWEAARTLTYLGLQHTLFEDSGVAGLWRLTSHLDAINACAVVIVVAGMDAALASVLGGLTPRPIFAVPTSVGYGMAQGGKTALASMLSSCASGVGVLNIDNGFGAACAAARIIQTL